MPVFLVGLERSGKPARQHALITHLLQLFSQQLHSLLSYKSKLFLRLASLSRCQLVCLLA
jgi:hypothetical protein